MTDDATTIRIMSKVAITGGNSFKHISHMYPLAK